MILPFEDESKNQQPKTVVEPFEDEESQFLTSAYLSTIEDDPQENQIWGKYL